MDANGQSIKISNEKDQITYCVQMNCLVCNLHQGNYEKCPHLDNKLNVRDKRPP